MYDSIIILSHEMDVNGNLSEESLSRLKMAGSMYFQKKSKNIITVGWDYRSDSDLFISDVYKSNLISMGVPANSIISENKSRDTVGDAFFSKKIALKFNWKKLLVITSEYHILRAKKIFQFIYGNEFNSNFVGVKSINQSSRKTVERKSLDSFKSTFLGIKKADDKEIYKCLKTNHPYYNGAVYPKI